MQKLFKLLFYSIKATFSKNKVIRLENKLKAFYIATSKMLEYVQIDDICYDVDRETCINFNGTYNDLCMEVLYAVDSITSNCIYMHGNSTHTPVFVYKRNKVHVNMQLQNMQVNKDRYRGNILVYSGFRED